MLIFSTSKIHYYPVKVGKSIIKNLFFLKLHITLLRVVAIIPFGLKSIKSKVFASCVLGPLVPATFLTTIDVLKFSHNHTFQKLLGSLSTLSLAILYCSILYSNWKSDGAWKNLLRTIFEFDETFSNVLLSAYPTNRTIFKFFLIYFSPLFYSCIDVALWIMGTNGKQVKYLLLITQHIGSVYEYQVAFFFWEIADILQSRYAHLEEQLSKLLDQNKKVTQRMSEYMIKQGIQKIKYKYTLLKKASEEINNIFGWIIVFSLFHVVLILLFDLYTILYVFSNRAEFLIQSCLATSSSLVSITMQGKTKRKFIKYRKKDLNRESK